MWARQQTQVRCDASYSAPWMGGMRFRESVHAKQTSQSGSAAKSQTRPYGMLWKWVCHYWRQMQGDPGERVRFESESDVLFVIRKRFSVLSSDPEDDALLARLFVVSEPRGSDHNSGIFRRSGTLDRDSPVHSDDSRRASSLRIEHNISGCGQRERWDPMVRWRGGISQQPGSRREQWHTKQPAPPLAIGANESHKWSTGRSESVDN